MEEFKFRTIQLCSWCIAELFYMFTVCNFLEPNDLRQFYRSRTLNVLLRILHAEYYANQFLFNSQGVAKALAAHKFDFRGVMEFKLDKSEILFAKIRHYALVNPLELAVFQ